MSPYNDDPRDQGLKITMKEGLMTISIGIDAMIKLICEGRALQDDPITVTDRNVFAMAVLHSLKRKETDGSTLMHTIFDVAAERAIIEDGCEGVEVGKEE